MPDSLPLFLFLVAIGTYIQAVTGFALGIFVLAAVTLLHLASIPVTATALNIMNLALGVVVVIPRIRKANWPILALCLAGMIPAMALGILTLDYLNSNAQHLLKMLLGGLIVTAGLVLAYRPDPLARRSSSGSFVAAGSLGGFFGGLFSISGPPMVYQMYRQPLPVQTIRITLLTLFSITSIARLVMVGVHGDLTVDIVKLGCFALPVVAVAAWVGNHYPPPVSERNMRRGIFILLIITGASIVLLS